MYSLIVQFSASVCLLIQVACGVVSSNSPPAWHKGPSAQEIQQRTNKSPISKEQAITVANEDVAKSNRTLTAFKVVVCERPGLWVVIYDGAGLEYYIDKISGAIVLVQKLPQSVDPGTEGRDSKNSRVVTETEAIDICKKHFVDFLVSKGDTKEHVNEYDAVACELATTWRVFFEYRATPGQGLSTLPNSNPPNYVVDKKSGQIIFTTHQIVK